MAIVKFLWKKVCYKDKSAAERNEMLRSIFMTAVGEYSAEQLIFIDESAKDERSILNPIFLTPI